MKVIKTRKPIEYNYYLGENCCDEFKAARPFFGADSKGCFISATLCPFEEPATNLYVTFCPFCGSMVEVEDR